MKWKNSNGLIQIWSAWISLNQFESVDSINWKRLAFNCEPSRIWVSIYSFQVNSRLKSFITNCDQMENVGLDLNLWLVSWFSFLWFLLLYAHSRLRWEIQGPAPLQLESRKKLIKTRRLNVDSVAGLIPFECQLSKLENSINFSCEGISDALSLCLLNRVHFLVMIIQTQHSSNSCMASW